MELSIVSVRDSLCQVENFIEYLIQEFEIEKGVQANVTLSVTEAVNNSILFGNKENPDKLVKLTAVKGKGRVVVTVEDEGEGFDFTQIPDPTTPDNLMMVTGRGLYLMVHLTDELLFARNGAKVVMTFFLNE